MKATVARLEEEVKGSSPAEKFIQLSLEEQEEILEDVNAGRLLDNHEKHTIDTYIKELSEKGGPKLINLRLDLAKAKLQELDSK